MVYFIPIYHIPVVYWCDLRANVRMDTMARVSGDGASPATELVTMTSESVSRTNFRDSLYPSRLVDLYVDGPSTIECGRALSRREGGELMVVPAYREFVRRTAEARR